MKTRDIKKNQKLKEHYLNQAHLLLKWLDDYKDEHSEEVKSILKSFVDNPVEDLSELLNNTRTEPERPYPWLYNIDINIAFSEIDYPSEEYLI